MHKPIALRIFVADSDPDGLRLVERSNWVGMVLVFQRALLRRVKRCGELGQTRMCLLLSPRVNGDGEMLHIAEVGRRLSSVREVEVDANPKRAQAVFARAFEPLSTL